MYHVYFASCVPAGGICHYLMQEDGSFTFCDKILCDRPMYQIIDDGSMYILLRQPFPSDSESGLISCRIMPDGSLSNVSGAAPTGGIVACHLCMFKGNVYMVNYLSGSISSSAGKIVYHTGHGPNPGRQEAPHTHMITPTPDGKDLMCTDLGIDCIFIYDENLNEISCAKAPAGSGPRHLAVLDSGHVACVNELSCTVDIYAFGDGKLSFMFSQPLVPALSDTSKGAAIRVKRDIIYISVRGNDTVTVFRWHDNRLEQCQCIPCGGKSPRDILVVGNILLCMNESSSTVTAFSLDKNGLLERKLPGDLHIESVLCAASISG